MLKLTRRQTVCAAGAGVIAASTLFQPEGAKAANKPINIGYWNSPHPDTYNKGTGAYEKVFGADWPVKYILLQSGAQVVNLMASGDLDLCFAGSSPLVAGYAKGVGMSMIYVASVVTAVEALVARKGIDAVAQLKGKKIATPFNSSAHYALLAALENAKLSQGQASIINMPPNQIMAAWQTGAIDAAYIWLPIQGELVNNGGKVIFTSSELAPIGKAIFNAYVVRNDFRKEHPDLVAAYLKQVAAAIKIYVQSPASVVPEVAKILSLTEDQVRDYMKVLTLLTPQEIASSQWMGKPGEAKTGVLNSLVQQAEFLKSQGAIDQIPNDFRPFVDASFVEKIG